MEDYNRSHRYRDDNRSSSYERNDDVNWDPTYNRDPEDWRGYNTGNRNLYSSDRERDYWNARNEQMNRNPDRDYDDNYRSRNTYNDRNFDYNRADYYRNRDYNRNYRSDYNNYRNTYNNRGDYNTYRRTERDRNEGWRDNYRNEDRDWWDRTKDEVSSWFGDDDAKRRRRMDEMYAGQHRGKGPKNYTRSQERIKEDVSDKLSDDSFLDASEIVVDVKGNEVTLSGQVDSRYSKHRAEDLAEDVTGVAHVQNNLRVVENSPQTNTGTNTTTGSSYNTTKTTKEPAKL